MFRGGCHCGKLRFQFQTSVDLSAFRPRECDCGFCTRHGVRYFSDPSGSLSFLWEGAVPVGRYRTGDEVADFLYCTYCGVMVGITLATDPTLFGAINCRTIDNPPLFNDPLEISPQKLDAREKIERWKAVWFPRVTISENRITQSKF